VQWLVCYIGKAPIAPQQTRFSQPGNAVAGAGIACEITLVNMDNTTSTAEQPLLCLSGELIGPANYQAINVTFDRQLQVYRFLFAPLVAGSYKFVASTCESIWVVSLLVSLLVS